MRRDDTHTHPCWLEKAGCTNLIECHTPLERDHHGDTDEGWFAYCPDANESLECAECAESRCAKCNCVVRLEGHDTDCDEGRETNARLLDLHGGEL